MAKKRKPQGFKAPVVEPDIIPVEETVDEGIEDPTIEIPAWEHSLMDVELEPVRERDLKNLLRDWRHGRATKTLRQVLSDGYVMVFGVVMIVAMLTAGVMSAQSSAAAAPCEGSCIVGRTLLPWVAMSASFGLTAMASRVFGPVVASAAEGFWLMDAPIRRGRLLGKRLVGVILATAVIAAGIGGLMSALTGHNLDEIWRWAVAMGVGAAGLTALAAAEQTWGRTWLISIVQWLFGLASVGTLFIIVSYATGWFNLSIPNLMEGGSVVWVALAGVSLLLGAGFIAFRRLGMIHRARLVSGGTLVSGMQGAAFAMDFGLMRDILVERDAVRRGHVRPSVGKGVRANALVWREVQRLWRYPKRIILIVASVVVPYAVAALGFHTFSPFISSLILLIGFVPMLGSMRIMTRTKGLARTLPLSNPQIRKAMSTVPAVFAVLWAIATTPAFWGMGTRDIDLLKAFITAGLTAAAGLLASIRWVTAKSANYSTPMMQTGFGAMPPGLIFNLIRGIDIVVIVTGPLLLGWSPWISFAIAVICTIALSGSYSMEEMQAMQAQMKKEQANGGGPPSLFGGSKPAAPVTKQKIAPPKGYRTPPIVK